MIKVIYNKVCGRCVQSEPLTSGMVGQPIHFEYSHDFDGLAVTAVFTDGKNTVDVVNPGNECIIPHEVLTTVGEVVKVGIYATRGNELVIPTVYAYIGTVLKGADPSGDVSIDPTLPIWAQTQALIGNLSQIETETKENLVLAINEVKQTADRKANAADLAPVATSGSYNDLSDKPTIPSVPTATIEANTAARHTHDNKTLLDSITEALKTAWSTASEWVSTNGANVMSHLSDGVKHITATERSAWNDKQDKLIAGENITIAADGKTISATGGGGGGSTVELDTTLTQSGKAADAKAVGDALAGKQDKLIAGDNITIAADGKTISATGGGASVELDTTLTQSGKAADAKAVGDALAGKQNTISDLEAIRSGAAKGATALQSVPNTYRTASEQDTIDSGKVDKVTGKGLSSNDYTDAAKAKVDALAPVATSGSYNDLTDKPTIPTAYDDTEVRQRIGAIEAKESTWDAKSNFSGNYNDLTDKPTIPAPVTEQTVSGWGFTKNTGTYSKPTGGIPKADLANDVQASLGKADTALQEHQSLAAYRTAEAQNIIDNGKQDKITSTNKLAYSLISGTPTVPTVPTNVSAFTNDAGYLTLATLPKYEGVVE